MDGFDFGAGALHLFVARTDAERRQVLAAIGPFWDGNEVWLLALGGVAVRRVPARARLRAVGLLLRDFPRAVVAHPARHRDRVPQPPRAPARGARRGTSCSPPRASSLPVLFGAALGNLLRGLPLDADGWFSLALFTDFTRA